MAEDSSRRLCSLNSGRMPLKCRSLAEWKQKQRDILGNYLRDVIKENLGSRNFRLFGPDETASNRLDAVYEVTGKEWMAEVEPVDENLTVDGRWWRS